jgi:hypothetical protein
VADIYYGVEFGGHKATVLRSSSPLPSSDVEVRLTYDANLNSKLKALQAMARLRGKVVESDFPPPTEQTAPTPILLGTFTAADGTLVTARGLDAVPSGWPTLWVGGADYWASDDDAGGSIQANSMRNARPTYTDARAGYAKTSGVTSGDFGALPPVCSVFPVVIFMDAEVTGGSGSDSVTFQIAAAGAAGSSALQLTLKDNGLATIYAQGETGGDGLPEFSLGVGRHKIAIYVTATESSSIANGSAVGTWGDIGSALTYNVVDAIVSNATGGEWINEVAVYQGITLSEAIALTA